MSLRSSQTLIEAFYEVRWILLQADTEKRLKRYKKYIDNIVVIDSLKGLSYNMTKIGKKSLII